MAQQISDPGFGTKVSGASGRIVNSDGTLNVKRVGDRFHTSDIYHYLLTARWWKFVLMVFAAYTVVNLVFAGVYIMMGTQHITNIIAKSVVEQLEAAFLFSAQTLTTVGYGNLAPRTTFVGAIAAFEALIGLLLFGIFTGVTYGRFARIQPRITFSEEAIIAPLRGERNAFMFRLVNERSSVVMDASANLLLAMTEVSSKDPSSKHPSSKDASSKDTSSSKAGRRFYSLPLEVSKINSLALNWTLVHPITNESPLFGLTAQDLRDAHAEFLVTVTAFDDTVGQNFYARTSYMATQVVHGRRYEPMFWTNEHGDVELHINKVHDHVEAELLSESRALNEENTTLRSGS